MDVRILGPLEVVRDGVALDLGRRQQRILLARLVVADGHAVSTDRLADDLWGDDPPGRPDVSLQALVSRLRRVLETDRAPRDPARLLVTRAPGYALLLPEESLDARRFATLAAEGVHALAAGDAPSALRSLEAALASWRGEVLADLADLAFVQDVAAAHGELRDAVREDHAAALLATGATAHALFELESLTRDRPLRERPWELLLTALHRAGRTAEALDRYRDVRARYADELGLDPGPALQAIEVGLLRGELPTGPVLAGPAADTAVVVAALDTPGSATSVDRDSEGVVGRARELDVLEAAVTQAVGGATRWVVLVGEPGIGKTRLAEQAAATAAGVGARVAWARTHEDGAAPALWPWVQVLRGLGAEDPRDVLQVATDALGDIAAGRFERADRVAGALATAAVEQPLVVLLDDLQWFDPESLRLVAHVGLQVRDVPLLVVVTVRAGVTTPGIDRVLADITRRPGAVRMDLQGLDLAATAALAGAVCDQPLAPHEVAELHARTTGNPYFVTEFARLGRSAIVTEVVPDGVRDVLRRRLAPLSESARSLLSLAALAGGEVALDQLTAAGDLDRVEVVEGLSAAVDAHVLRPLEVPGHYQFAHALLRSTLREDLPDLQRRRLHLRLAEALAGPAATDPERWLAERAGHLVAAAPLADPTATVTACLAAADLATHRLAHDDVVRWRMQALRVVDGDHGLASDRAARLAVLTALGHARGIAGDHVGALATLAEAIDVAEELGDAPAMARAVQGFDLSGGVWFWVPQGTRPRAQIDRIDRTLAALGRADTAERVRVLVVRAAGEYYGDQDRGIAFATEAVEMAERIGDPLLVVEARAGALQVAWRPQGMTDQQDQATRLLALAGHVGSGHHELLARTRLFTIALDLGDVRTAEQHHADAIALARELRATLVEAQLAWSRSMFAGIRGDLAGARRLADTAEDLHRRTGLYALERAVGQIVGLLCWDLGTLHDLDGDRRAMVFAGFPEAAVADHHRAGRTGDARDLLAELTAVPLLPSYEWLGLTVVHARLAADLGEVLLSERLREALLPHRGHVGHFGTVACAGPVDLQLGRLASLLGHHDEAIAGLRAGIDHAERERLPVWGVRSREALAVALRRRDHPGDRERADVSVREAADGATALGIALEPHVASRDVPMSPAPRPR
ncbi:BTAD domain-containing putative transcriptional regulator [Salsipaludibacter albus]|uniref:BTAD domain-containing putative transcriptional regulator n=1 Tax=Salsipaludibacter albus TaxID=2849650 RepID=UPI001EE4258D|nr:BTAD domain-containing putative transcriptional regulator [Salsipaludibacter albus]MBY5163944.1 AAA family ATPase [Salsipaludibacter albus]